MCLDFGINPNPGPGTRAPEVEEIQRPLNQKLSSKPSEIVDFALRFVLLINFKFEIHIFSNYYESRCKINGSRKFKTHFLVQNPLHLPTSKSTKSFLL
jgi:hypothetical protein